MFYLCNRLKKDRLRFLSCSSYKHSEVFLPIQVAKEGKNDSARYRVNMVRLCKVRRFVTFRKTHESAELRTVEAMYGFLMQLARGCIIATILCMGIINELMRKE